MIVRLSAAIIGLLAFAGMLLAGYVADNPLTTILLRALLGLLCGLGVGATAGMVGQVLIRDNLMRILAADAALEAPEASEGPVGQVSENSGSVEFEPGKEPGISSREHNRASGVESPAQRAARQVLQEL